jgi:hypothetical protein
MFIYIKLKFYNLRDSLFILYTCILLFHILRFSALLKLPLPKSLTCKILYIGFEISRFNCLL